MHNEIIINANAGETRVAILERSTFTELLIERHADRNVMGNVVKGRVNRVLPGMQAAFVDIGLEKAAFLYAGDYHASKPNGDGGPVSRSRRGGNGPMPPKIETVLSEGQEIVVQVAKEPAQMPSWLAHGVAGSPLSAEPSQSLSRPSQVISVASKVPP